MPTGIAAGQFTSPAIRKPPAGSSGTGLLPLIKRHACNLDELVSRGAGQRVHGPSSPLELPRSFQSTHSNLRRALNEPFAEALELAAPELVTWALKQWLAWASRLAEMPSREYLGAAPDGVGR